AVVLGGAGTAGAYQAGVLRAMTEAGVKIDVLAAHGSGILNALACAIDGGPRVWDQAGPWTSPRLSHAYRWRLGLRLAGWGIVGAGVVLASPLVVLAIATTLYLLSLLAGLVHAPGVSAWFIDVYHRSLALLFTPPIIPSIVPGALVLAM